MGIVTFLLFVAACVAIVAVWNLLFNPVRWPVAALLWLICAAYMSPTLLTSRVDVPANLSFVAYPWKATAGQPVQANTGIVWAQIAPWSRVARDVLKAGEAPLWNRYSASGAPLLANQQSAIFHPFTLFGLLLPLGKAFTLTAALRLFFVAFFSFIVLRNWDIGPAAALFGALAYTFSTFHVVWLLFPLGLSSMMLPICIAGVQELGRAAKARSYVLLVAGLSLAILGGHPESALWVWICAAFIAVYEAVTRRTDAASIVKCVGLSATAFIVAMLLTLFFWWPTLRALRETSRFEAVRSVEANPANHGLTAEWLFPLVAPNVFGTPVDGSYTPPKGFHPAVLNDYGEVASGYAGLITVGLAVAAPFLIRRRVLLVAGALMLFSLATIAEAPYWRDVLRSVPFVGISIHQRLRLFWDLGVCIAAAVGVDHLLGSVSGRRRAAAAILGVSVLFVALYLLQQTPSALRGLRLAQFIVPVVTAAVAALLVLQRRLRPVAVTTLVLLDLMIATWRYNPPAKRTDLYPATGALSALSRARKPVRVAALGWSALPDTLGYYGIEDVKTTDPVSNARYMRLLRGYLDVDPASYDLLIRDVSQPFFDFMNIGLIYVPPDIPQPADTRFVPIYRGSDGTVLKNTRVVPRYFFVKRFSVEPSFDKAVWRSRDIRDFRVEALVDHVPSKVAAQAPDLGRSGWTDVNGGMVRVLRYESNRSVLDVKSEGWNLLVSSDVHWPGWRAYWNGKRQPPVVVNGAFVGCFVPPGAGELILRYAPDEFTTGRRISAATGVLLLLAMVVWSRRSSATA